MNAIYDLNLIRPTIAPEIRAGVIIANIPWNTINVYVGIVPDVE